MRLAAAASVIGVSAIALAMLAGAGESTDDDRERRLSKNDRRISAHARRLIEERLQ